MRLALLGAMAVAVGCGGPVKKMQEPVHAEARAPRSVMSSAAVAAQQRAEREARAELEQMMKANGAPDVESFLDELRVECEDGQASSCGHLGLAYEFGNSVDVDVDEAARLYKRGCRLGSNDVCRTLTQVANLRIDANPADTEAAKLLRFACDEGYIPGCTSLGEKYARGHGVQTNRQKAAELFAQTCEVGDDVGCLRLVQLTLKLGTKLRKARLVRGVLRRMCKEGGANACELLGEIYRRGLGIAKNAVSAFLYHTQACDLDVDRCMDLGDRYLTGRSAKRSAKRALVFFRKICKVDAESCADAAGRLWKRKQYVSALAYFERACDGGDAEACVDAGVVLASGRKVKKDLKRAWELFDRACAEEPSRCQKLAKKYKRPANTKPPALSKARTVRKQKDDGESLKIESLSHQCRLAPAGDKPSAADGAACLELAGIYASTKSHRRDAVKAALYYNEACGLEEAWGCLRLGDMYRDGRGVDQSGSDAASLYRQACNADEPFGCWRLGRLYRDGTVVTKDLDKAREWLQRACDTGAQSACSDIDKLPRKRRRK